MSEVVGETTKTGLAEYIQSACSQKGKAVSVDEINLAPLTTNRAITLADNSKTWSSNVVKRETKMALDDILGQALEPILSSGSYTILFIGTPGEKNYQPEFEDPVRMDLKRHVQSQPIRQEKNETKPERDTRPLFEKYQFFTPGKANSHRSNRTQTNRLPRNLHGSHHRNRAFLHSRRWPESPCQSRGLIRCVRQGHGPCRSEEAVVIVFYVLGIIGSNGCSRESWLVHQTWSYGFLWCDLEEAGSRINTLS